MHESRHSRDVSVVRRHVRLEFREYLERHRRILRNHLAWKRSAADWKRRVRRTYIRPQDINQKANAEDVGNTTTLPSVPAAEGDANATASCLDHTKNNGSFYESQIA